MDPTERIPPTRPPESTPLLAPPVALSADAVSPRVHHRPAPLDPLGTDVRRAHLGAPLVRELRPGEVRMPALPVEQHARIDAKPARHIQNALALETLQ